MTSATIARHLGVGLIAVELALIILLLRQLNVQSFIFRRTLGLAGVGFVIHHFLPPRLRLNFFVALSVAAILLALGYADGQFVWQAALAVRRTVTLLVIGLGLIGLCHLPVGFWLRAGLLAVAGGSIGLLRAPNRTIAA